MVADHGVLPPHRVAAFFDVDRTLLRGSSLLHVARPMRAAGLLPTRAMLRSLIVQARFSRFGFDEAQIREGVQSAGGVVAGIDAAALARFAEEVVPTHVAPRVYPAARAQLEWHRAEGHRIFLVSSSPRQFITVLGSMLGVEDVAATEAEVRDGRYSGAIIRFCHGAGKADSVRELAARHDIDLSASYAYGDSFVSDLPMLELVGHPTCANGDRALVAEAQRRGWPVISFDRASTAAEATTARQLPAAMLRRSAPAVRRAGTHVRTAARSLRGL